MRQTRQRVCIQGLGYVGSAVAVAVAAAKDQSGNPLYDVVGVDLPTESGQGRVDAINRGKFPFSTSDRQLIKILSEVQSAGNLSATIDESVYEEADFVIVDIQMDVSTDVNDLQVGKGLFLDAIQAIGRRIRDSALVIIETTVAPGTCDKLVLPALQEEFLKRGLAKDSVLLAHSFERVMPGKEYLNSIINICRVYSGHSIEAGDICEKFLSSYINVERFPLTRVSSILASETAKVLENTYRTVNIAFIDEWTRYAELVGIDLFEVIDAIRARPTHSNIRVPGLGVGGYCLTKDPLFIPATVEEYFGENDLTFPFSTLSVKVNKAMPSHTVKRLVKLLNGEMLSKEFLVCGVGYRQETGDTRHSPSEVLIAEIEGLGGNVTAYDPYVSFWVEMGRQLPEELPNPSLFDAIIFAVPHEEFMLLDIVKWLGDTRPLVLDAVNAIDYWKRIACREIGVQIESIGRGDGL